jgi:hypothetical protein
VERRFEWADQLEFARLSGDHNPLHVDALTARRLLFGEPVVHGIHLLLWVLDVVTPAMQGLGASSGRSIRVRFRKPVFVGETVRLTVSEEGGGVLQCALRCDETVLMSVRIAVGDAPADVPGPSSGSTGAAPSSAVPDAPGLDELAGLQGALNLPADSAPMLAERFPALAAWIGADRVGALALLSTLVGMRVPGLHSLFAALTLRVGARTGGAVPPARLDYRVTTVSTQFRMVRAHAMAAGVDADVEAFCRPTPGAPCAAAIEAALPAGAFSGRSVLVVGGSRGLGELAARMTATAGARVVITYARGVDEARALARLPGITATALDVTALADEALDACFAKPVDTLIYCATPRIFFRRTRPLHADRLSAFMACYVTGFARVFERFAAQAPPGAHCLHPSSVAAGQDDPDTVEYRLAKQAGEALCASLEALYPQLALHRPRLPRLDTDQTAQIGAPPPEDTLACMTGLLGALCAPGFQSM